MTYFLDASALVKRYVSEPGSDRVHALLRRRSRFVMSRISVVEVPSAIWKRSRAGDIGMAEARRLVARFAGDVAYLAVVELRSPTLDLARHLVEHHPLRAYDAVQLASALRWARETGLAVTFVCADVRLARAATVEKVRTVAVG